MDNNNQENKGFSYTYSAKEQAELKRIREKYIEPIKVEDKMERLRKLDRGVTNTAQTVALIFGIIGTILLGCGMSLCMTDIGAILALSTNTATVIGIIIGVIGGIIASLAYPLYNVILKAKRKKFAPEIIRLTDELMK